MRYALLAIAALLALLPVAAAQQQLVVNGQPVPGLTTTLVRGVSYAPAEALASALGAAYSFDAGASAAVFEVAARLLTLRVYSDPEAAARDTAALRLDGATRPGEGGVLALGVVYAPVKALIQALGGSISYLESRQTVLAVLPRATVEDAAVTQGGRRVVVTLRGLTAHTVFFDRALGALTVRFDRADMAGARSLAGQGFSRAVLAPSAGYVELRLTLEPNHHHELYTAPTPEGFAVVLDIVPDGATPLGASPERRIVLDPGHGGRDPGLDTPQGPEAALTLSFALALADELAARGYAVELTREGDADLSPAERARVGLGVSLFLSLHADLLPPGRYNLYYLSDLSSAPSATLALRENAAAALDDPGLSALRRRLLLLTPDLDAGPTYARALSGLLGQQAGLQASALMGAPLGVLEGAAGRGLMLELSPADLADPALPTLVAAAVARVVEAHGE